MNNAFSSLLLKTLLLSISMLICLSLSMWLLAQYNPETGQRESGLINTVQAKVVPPSSPSNPPSITAQQALSTSHLKPTKNISTPFIQQIKADKSNKTHQIILRFEHPQATLSAHQISFLQSALQQISVGRSDHVKITAGSVSLEQHVSNEQQLKQRTQAIARVVFAHTQQVEIGLGEILPETGIVRLEVNSLPK